MYDYNCPDCNDAKLQSDKNARKINEVIEQVNALIQVLGDLRTEVDNILINKEKVIYGTQPPIYGYWAKGSKVYNTEPSVGSYVGWICVESGTSGIWKPFGAIVD